MAPIDNMSQVLYQSKCSKMLQTHSKHKNSNFRLRAMMARGASSAHFQKGHQVGLRVQMIVRVRSKDAFEILINGHEQIFVVLESLFHLNPFWGGTMQNCITLCSMKRFLVQRDPCSSYFPQGSICHDLKILFHHPVN